jgi:hypothetical protein
VSSAKLDEQGVNGANLNAMPPASISNLCGINVILAIWLDESKSSKALYDTVACLRASKALEQLLQYKSSAKYLICTEESTA